MEVAKRDPEPIDPTERLPAELKTAVLRYSVTLADRKALVLVNKAWAEVVLPFLWETLTTDLVQKGKRDLLGVSHPKSNILKHVRTIFLLQRTVSSAEDILPTLLVAIPRGQLKGLTSSGQIPIQTLNILLMSHPKLERLVLPAHSGLSAAIQSPWTSGCFSSLTNMALPVDGFTSAGLRRFWDECPKLVKLQLKGGSNPTFAFHNNALPDANHSAISEDAFLTNDNDPSSPLRPLQPLHVQHLRIEKVTLPSQLGSMMRRFDSLAISTLMLHDLRDISGLLEAMAIEFTKGHPRLIFLHIKCHARQDSSKSVTSLGKLLLSFRGLRSLGLQYPYSNKLDVEGILNHGATMKCLYIVNGSIHGQDAQACLDASDLSKIATACPKLEQLCLNLYEIDTDREESDILGPLPGESFTPNEFEQALGAIASLPKLSVLRLTNPPNYRKAFHTVGEHLRYFRRNLQSGIERQGFRARADSLMQYLGDHGSNIKVLAFSPVDQLKKADSPDKHGHVWPHYYYSGVRMKDDKGKELVIARPLIDWKEQFPDARVLNDVKMWTW